MNDNMHKILFITKVHCCHTSFPNTTPKQLNSHDKKHQPPPLTYHPPHIQATLKNEKRAILRKQKLLVYIHKLQSYKTSSAGAEISDGPHKGGP